MAGGVGWGGVEGWLVYRLGTVQVSKCFFAALIAFSKTSPQNYSRHKDDSARDELHKVCVLWMSGRIILKKSARISVPCSESKFPFSDSVQHLAAATTECL